MKAFISLGFLLQALFVLGHAESTASLEERDLTSPQSTHPQELSKRKTSPRNLVVCPSRSGEGIELYLNDYNKLLTALVSRKVPCAYFANMAMLVVDHERKPARFTNSDPSFVRNWYGSQLTDQCQAQKPVLLRSKLPPVGPDDYLCIGTAFYHDNFASKQVETCTKEDEDDLLHFLLSYH